MDVVVRGRNVSVSPSLREAATSKLGRLERYGNGTTRAEIDFSEMRNRRVHDNQRCEVLVHLDGALIRAEASATEQHAALDLVLERVEQQARKLKEKRVGRSHPRHPAKARFLRRRAAARLGEGILEPEASPADAPRIALVDRFAAKPMSPDEAADQLDLTKLDFLFFANAETGRTAVLYRREGGRLGLIDSGG